MLCALAVLGRSWLNMRHVSPGIDKSRKSGKFFEKSMFKVICYEFSLGFIVKCITSNVLHYLLLKNGQKLK